MSICKIGLDAKLKTTTIALLVLATDPLIRLANLLSWQEMGQIVEKDLKKTSKGFWYLGRRLCLRTHLAVFTLQLLLKLTDRGMEERILQTPALQLFSGYGVVSKWKSPDHTKIEEFRNRLSTETQKKLGDYILKVAVEVGFADPTWMDVDSTVQEANMAYPSDASLLKKLSLKVNKVIEFLIEKAKPYFPKNLSVDIKSICKKAQAYFFLSKIADIKKKRKVFKEYFYLVKHELKEAVTFLENLTPRQINSLPWNIAKECRLIQTQAWSYLLDVAHFTRTHTVRKTKQLAFHVAAAVCISKGKAAKKHEFGRQVQIGRIGGNFLVPLSTEIKMEDKKSLTPMVDNHAQIFGQGLLKEVGCDKGYYSRKNIKNISAIGINTDGVQRPANAKLQLPKEITDPLRDRRAGIEPLIGHLKSFGLAKSKMKSDESTHSSVYSCTMGFNLHQILRNIKKPNAAA
jgi:transposase, IS5 family